MALILEKQTERYYLVLKDYCTEVYNDWDTCLRYITGVENQHYKYTDKDELMRNIRHFYSRCNGVLVVDFKEYKRDDNFTPDDFLEFLEAYKSE